MDTTDTQLEVMPSSALEQIERAQYDIAVATAHKYPRNPQLFLKDAIALVQSDQETAESCIFRRPVGKKGGREEFAEGMSVRMSEIVAACYGNIVFQAIIIEQTPRFVKARGQARDLQKNVSASSEVVESTVTKDGQPFSERMRIVVAKAALSKARRDAIFQVVPRALCKPIEAAARNVITGSQKPLSERRAAVMAWISKSSIGEARVWAALGIGSVEELNNDQLVELQGIRTAIKEGEITIDDAFPRVEQESASVAEMLKPKPKPQPRSEPPKAATAKAVVSDNEPWETLEQIVKNKQCGLDDLLEALIGDAAIEPLAASMVKTFRDVPKEVAEKYLGTDYAGAELIRSLNFVLAQRKS